MTMPNVTYPQAESALKTACYEDEMATKRFLMTIKVTSMACSKTASYDDEVCVFEVGGLVVFGRSRPIDLAKDLSRSATSQPDAKPPAYYPLMPFQYVGQQ